MSTHHKTKNHCRAALLDALEPRRLLTTWYVDAAGTAPAPDGTSWSAAYPDLQLALAAATPGDAIKVAQGTYKPTPTTDRTISFRFKNGVALLGGYAGSASPTPDARDLTAYPAVLSGDIGTPGDNSDNSYQILVATDTDATAVLDGFTVTAANGSPTASGALHFANGTTATISNCLFTANTATSANGAAVYTDYASASFSNCTFANNSVTGSSLAGRGGAVYTQDSPRSTFTNCTFADNSAQDAGGALCGGANLSGCTFTGNSAERGGAIFQGGTFTDCTFTANSAYVGGALYVGGGVISHCTFTANSTAGDGGAAYLEGNANFTDCTFTRNSSVGDGGAVATNTGPYSPQFVACAFYGNSAANGGAVRDGSYKAANPLFADCTFVGNTATSTNGQGGAIRALGNATITNCTFTANAAGPSGGGGGVYAWTDVTTFYNSILWANTASYSPQFGKAPSANDSSAIYSDIQGGYAGTGNISADPRFYRAPSPGPDATWGTPDDDYGDLRLLPDSPATDVGRNTLLPPSLTTDLAGNPRTVDFPATGTPAAATVDMGAYEASTNLGALHLTAGQSVTLPAGGYAFIATQLALDPGATLDLADDSLLIDYPAAGPSPLPAIRSALASGYNGGSWTGAGIVSSAPLTHPNHAIAYAEAADLGLTTFNNQPVDATALLLKYTAAGDANLDGALTPDDFALLDRGHAKGLNTWIFGDFDYDATVTDADAHILATACAPAATDPATPAEPSTVLSSEPTPPPPQFTTAPAPSTPAAQLARPTANKKHPKPTKKTPPKHAPQRPVPATKHAKPAAKPKQAAAPFNIRTLIAAAWSQQSRRR